MPIDYMRQSVPWQCVLCGVVTDPATQPVQCSHTPQEWDTWRIGQGIADGVPYGRWKAAPAP